MYRCIGIHVESTDIQEKVYARFLPETLSSEVARLARDINSLSIV